MNKIKRLFLIPSAVALMLLIADAEIKYCLIAVLLGLLLGAFLFYKSRKISDNKAKADRIIVTILGVLTCVLLSNVFYRTWMNHQYRMKDLIELFFSDYSSVLRFISALIAVVAIPSVMFILSLLVPCLRMAIQDELLADCSKPKIMKRILVIMCCLIIAALIGYISLIGVYLLPVDRINDNVRESAYTIQKEGTFPTLSNWFMSELDNYTDSIMLLESSEKIDISASVDAMNNPHGLIGEMDYAEIVVAHFLQNKPFDKTFYYARYWHGYLVWLKPLLVFMDYSSIRIINGIIQLILVIVFCFVLKKNNLEKGIIPLIFAYMMLMPLALAKSFQYSSCFYAFMLGSIWLLLMDKEKRRKQAFLVFLFVGIFTAYFDFLTYPIATFGVVALFYFMSFEADTLERKIADMLSGGLCWGIGYVGMWAEKWVLASIVTKNDIIKNALRSIRERTGTVSLEGGAYYGVISCEIQNYRAFLKTPVTLLAIIYSIVLLVRIIRNRKSLTAEKMNVIIPYVLIGLLPALWYAFTLNHSSNHFFFTNKACVTSFLALMLGLISLGEKVKDQE